MSRFECVTANSVATERSDLSGMDCAASSDVVFLSDEKFDFDVSLSPCSAADEDEDEVFVGPVSHKERCVSEGVVSGLQGGGGGGTRGSWSPLTGEQLEAMCQEAHKLADQLHSDKPNEELAKGDGNTEDFIQDSEAKLEVLDPAARVLSPVKRETFCVQDSPMKQLPPAIQRRILRGSSTRAAQASGTSASTASSARLSASTTSSARLSISTTSSARLSTSTTSSARLSASTTSSARLSTSTASSARLSVSTASSARLSVSTASSARLSVSTASSARLSVSTASSARLSVSTASSARLSVSSACRASPSDGVKASARPALRVKASLGGAVMLPNRLAAPSGSCSASKGRTERTRLQPPSKVASGLKRSPSSRRSTRSESCEDLLSDSASVTSDLSDSSVSSSMSGKRTLAPPTKQTVGVRKQSGGKAPPPQNRRNTSSSSSSVSSFNSSMSLSPAKGKVNSLSGSTGPAPDSVSRARRSTVELPRPAAGRRSLSAHSRLPEAECVKAVRPSLLKRADSTPIQSTPSKRLMERRASGRPQGALKALVLPTPGAGSRAAAHAEDVSSVPRPKRLVSLSSMDSLPQKPSLGPLTPSAGGSTSLQMKTRRPSALPTPGRRRVSAIPSPLSANLVRSVRSVRPAAVPDPDMGSARKEYSFSPAAKPVQEEEEPADVPDIQPFCLEEEEEETSPPHQPEQTESPSVNQPSREEAEPGGNTREVQTPEQNNGKTKEVLLLDLPAPAPRPQEKLLIDLTNTPDLIRTTSKTGSAAQLIDLSSPLIKWSPERSEKTAQLINLSF